MQALVSAPTSCYINCTRRRRFIHNNQYDTSKDYPFSSSPTKSLCFSSTHLPFQSQNLVLYRKPISLISRGQLLCSNSSTAITADGDDNKNKSFGDWIQSVGETISVLFPLWVALGCLIGLLKPSSYNWVKPQWTVMGITLTMLGMGMTLTFDDLRGALAMPKELFCGFILQYSVMPLSGYFVSKLLNLPSHYAAGLILVGCCPGGMLS